MTGTPYPVRLTEAGTGRWTTHAYGYEIEAVTDGPVWVVYIDGIERFTAHRLATAERKIEDWIAAQ